MTKHLTGERLAELAAMDFPPVHEPDWEHLKTCKKCGTGFIEAIRDRVRNERVEPNPRAAKKK